MLALFTNFINYDFPSSPPSYVEVPRELSSYVGAPQTSTLKGERREIISYISWDHRVPTYYDHDCSDQNNGIDFLVRLFHMSKVKNKIKLKFVTFWNRTNIEF